MSDTVQQSGYHYIAYVDEAGDPGLKRLRPEFPQGSSEWFVLSGVVVSAANEMAVRDWIPEMLEATRGNQKPGRRADLHFRAMNDNHKSIACAMLASKPVRCFCICSHKKSLLDWPHSPALHAMGNRDWFYSFLTRYLLERVTHFVADNSKKTHGEIKRVKVVYSDRGGLSVGRMTAYYDKLKNQSRSGRTVLKRGRIIWDTFHHSLLHHANHKASAGLQLADIVASSFFRACDQHNTGDCNPSFAWLLRGKMARVPDKKDGEISGYGVKLLPEYKPDLWLPIQSKIFSDYGYPKEWWDPVPPTPPYFK
jgi:hypothetical protein